MHVLILTYHDLGGGTHRLARAINEHTDSEAVSAHWNATTWTQGGLYQPNIDTMRELFDWADVVQVQNTIIPAPPYLWSTKPLVFYYRGDDFRLDCAAIKQRDVSFNAVESVNFLDLAVECSVDRWLPLLMEDYGHLKTSHAGFKIAQCPSTKDRYAAKFTDEVVRVMQNSDLDFRLITGVSWQPAMEQKAAVDVVIDQFLWGYGNSGLEAMSMGIPVVADARPEIVAEMEKRIGYLPFVRCSVNELPEKCARLRDDPSYYLERAEIGRQYWRDFHSPPVVAWKAVEMFQEAIDLWGR